MPGGDGTGPFGSYENCVPRGDDGRYYPSRGRRFSRGYGYNRAYSRADFNAPKTSENSGDLERIVGTGVGPCGNGIPRGGGRGFQGGRRRR